MSESANEFDDVSFGDFPAPEPEEEQEAQVEEESEADHDDETVERDGQEEDPEVDPDEDSEDDVDEEEQENKEPPKQYQDSKEEVEKARADGWTPFDEWVKAGNDPGEWKTAKHFNEVGKLYNNQRRQQKEHQNEIKNTQLLMEARLRDVEQKHEQYGAQLKEAVESGNYDEVQRLTKLQNQNTVEQWTLQNQLKQSDPQQQMIQREVEWEKQNPWFNVQDPTNPNFEKSRLVASAYQRNAQQGMNFEAAIESAVKEVEAQMTSGNPNRERKSITDNKSASRKSSSPKNFNELPSDAKREWEKYGEELYDGDKKAFVKAYNNLSKKG